MLCNVADVDSAHQAYNDEQQQHLLELIFTPAIQGTRPLTLAFPASHTVRTVKAALSPLLRNIDPAAFTLVHASASRALRDQDTLTESGLHSHANISIVLNTATARPLNAAAMSSSAAAASAAALAISPHLALLRDRLAKFESVVLSDDGESTCGGGVGTAGASKRKHTPGKAGAMPPLPANGCRSQIRTKAKELLRRGVAGLVVIPGPAAGQKRVVMLDSETLVLLKAVREARRRAGRECLSEGSDADMLRAMDGALGAVPTEIECMDTGADVSVGGETSGSKKEELSSSHAQSSESSNCNVNDFNRAKLHALQQRIRESAQARKEAMRRALGR